MRANLNQVIQGVIWRTRKQASHRRRRQNPYTTSPTDQVSVPTHSRQNLSRGGALLRAYVKSGFCWRCKCTAFLPTPSPPILPKFRVEEAANVAFCSSLLIPKSDISEFYVHKPRRSMVEWRSAITSTTHDCRWQRDQSHQLPLRRIHLRHETQALLLNYKLKVEKALAWGKYEALHKNLDSTFYFAFKCTGHYVVGSEFPMSKLE